MIWVFFELTWNFASKLSLAFAFDDSPFHSLAVCLSCWRVTKFDRLIRPIVPLCAMLVLMCCMCVHSDTAVPRLGTMVSIPLFSHRPRTLNLLQQLCGVQMWRCGSSNKVWTLSAVVIHGKIYVKLRYKLCWVLLRWALLFVMHNEKKRLQ